jgi:hypothetical protein
LGLKLFKANDGSVNVSTSKPPSSNPTYRAIVIARSLSTTKILLLELWLANARVYSDDIVYYDYNAEILRLQRG